MNSVMPARIRVVISTPRRAVRGTLAGVAVTLMGLLLIAAPALRADPPPAVINLITSAADSLTTDDASRFLSAFDSAMPGFAALHDRVEGLLAAYNVGSTVEVISDSGDDSKRILELDWLLTLSSKTEQNPEQISRRQVVRCTLELKSEKRKKQWKITAIDPTGFFK
jgi:hypothetical protein